MTETPKRTRRNNDIRIDKHIPMPAKATRYKYPWMLMEIGDSFCTKSAGLQTAVRNQNTHSKRKFVAHRTPEGTRVWRIA